MRSLQREFSLTNKNSHNCFLCFSRKTQQPLIASKQDDKLIIHDNSSELQVWSFNENNEYYLHLLSDITSNSERQQESTLAALNFIFSHRQDLTEISVTGISENTSNTLISSGALLPTTNDDSHLAKASMFWQQSALWLIQSNQPDYPLRYTISNGKRHPLRAPKHHGLVYSRHIPWLNGLMRFYTIDIERDLKTINTWMNTPSVAEFYDEAGSLDYHKDYMQKQLDDPHTLPLIAFFNETPFAYFEVYWAKEDRIAPFYTPDDFDRGWHMLVGDENFRGKDWFTAWCSSIIHFMFLDDNRTQSIVCEPRYDHPKLIKNLDKFGFAKLKEFDFPHKRSMLLQLLRERFFDENMGTDFVDNTI